MHQSKSGHGYHQNYKNEIDYIILSNNKGVTFRVSQKYFLTKISMNCNFYILSQQRRCWPSFAEIPAAHINLHQLGLGRKANLTGPQCLPIQVLSTVVVALCQCSKLQTQRWKKHNFFSTQMKKDTNFKTYSRGIETRIFIPLAAFWIKPTNCLVSCCMKFVVTNAQRSRAQDLKL